MIKHATRVTRCHVAMLEGHVDEVSKVRQGHLGGGEAAEKLVDWPTVDDQSTVYVSLAWEPRRTKDRRYPVGCILQIVCPERRGSPELRISPAHERRAAGQRKPCRQSGSPGARRRKTARVGVVKSDTTARNSSLGRTSANMRCSSPKSKCGGAMGCKRKVTR